MAAITCEKDLIDLNKYEMTVNGYTRRACL